MTFLLEGVDVDTDGTGVKADGGSKTVAIFATDFGAGTVTLQGSPDGGVTWINLTVGGSAATFTANAIDFIDRLGQGMQIRATLTGADGSTDNVNVKIFQ